jgi:putative NIF3 family GTP cyclohydrolase 1 type 2
MSFGKKLIVFAVLALTAGIAFASPLAILPLNVKPFPNVPQGRKADFSVDIVYASFGVHENLDNHSLGTTPYEYNETNGINETEPYQPSQTYMVVLNVTNLSDIEASISEVGFAAAHDVRIIPSALGGFSFSTGEGPGVDFGGVVKGVWLDNKWLNVTWISDTDYPFNLIRIVTPSHSTVTAVPELPANATEEGTWIEGVPIAEYYNSTALESTSLYINGSWVDVTGRVRADPEQPMVMAANTLVNQILPFSGKHYRNIGNATLGPTTEMPSWQTYNGNGPTIQWPSIADGFNSTWAPHQSRLIVLNGTLEGNAGTLETGNITLYATASTYVNDWLVNGTYYDTITTSTWLNQVQLNAANGYLYNTVLSENQQFQLDQYGVEAFIEPSS